MLLALSSTRALMSSRSERLSPSISLSTVWTRLLFAPHSCACHLPRTSRRSSKYIFESHNLLFSLARVDSATMVSPSHRCSSSPAIWLKTVAPSRTSSSTGILSTLMSSLLVILSPLELTSSTSSLSQLRRIPWVKSALTRRSLPKARNFRLSS